MIRISELVKDSLHYVNTGLVRDPVLWILVSILGIGDMLFQVGGDGFFMNILPGAEQGIWSFIPPQFNQYIVIIALLLVCAGFILFILQKGYLLRVYRGISPVPPINDWNTLFLDGIRYFIIRFVYFVVPALILVCTVFLPHADTVWSHLHVTSPHALAAIPDAIRIASAESSGVAIGGVIIAGLLSLFLTLFYVIGIIRFSRTQSLRSAFEITEILQIISRIGWYQYILSLVSLAVVTMVLVWGFTLFLSTILSLFLLLGRLAIPDETGVQETAMGIIVFVLLFVYSYLLVFAIRYLAVLYDSEAGEVSVHASSGTGR